MTSLRRVNFFDKKLISLTSSETSETLASTTCACSGGSDGSIWFGTSRGIVGRLDVSFSLTASIQACPSEIIQLKSAKQAILALGQLSDGACRLCAYHLFRTGTDNNPLLLGSVRIPFELNAVCFDVMPDFSYIAVGCANGNTLLYSGSTFGRTGVKPKILAPSEDSSSAVTNVAFVGGSSSQNIPPSLFIVSEKQVTCMGISLGSTGDVSVEILSSDTTHGAPRPFMGSYSSTSSSLLVARNDTVFGFVPDQGNISALPIVDESHTIERLESWKQYLAVLSRDGEKNLQINICNLTPRFIAHSSIVNEEIVAIVPGAFDGHCVVILGKRKNGISIFLLREKALPEQIHLLQEKGLFEWAIEIAQRDNQPNDVLVDIYRSYADSYFEKGEYEKATAIYMRTIDEGYMIETSYVVSKFLLDKHFRNIQAVKQVAQYLKRLHEVAKKKPDSTITIHKEQTVLMILCFNAVNDSESVGEIMRSIPVSNLLDMLVEIPSMIKTISRDDFVRVFNSSVSNARRLVEVLLELQETEQLVSMLKKTSDFDKSIMTQVVEQSKMLKNFISHSIIDGEAELSLLLSDDPTATLHTDFCRTKKIGSTMSHLSDMDSFSTDFLLVLLEIILRTKSGSCKDVVKVLIGRNRAIEALSLCKLFGAPGNIILQLSAALNTPFEALAYPAVNLMDVTTNIPSSQDMTLQSIAIQKKLGQKSDWGSVRSIASTPVAVLLDTVDEGSKFVNIKSRIFDEFSSLEKSISESENRAKNDMIECERMKTEINTIRKRPQVHQFGRPCALCKAPITDMPAVFYKCMHGYHLHCASPDQNGNVVVECHVCQTESRHHMNVLNQRKESVKRADDLFKCMAGSDGKRFEVAMAYLGHGLFT